MVSNPNLSIFSISRDSFATISLITPSYFTTGGVIKTKFIFGMELIFYIKKVIVMLKTHTKKL